MSEDRKQRLRDAADARRRSVHLAKLPTAERLASQAELVQAGTIARQQWRCSSVPASMKDLVSCLSAALAGQPPSDLILTVPLGLVGPSEEIDPLLRAAFAYVVGEGLSNELSVASLEHQLLMTVGVDEHGAEFVFGVKVTGGKTMCLARVDGELVWIPARGDREAPYFSLGEPELWPPPEEPD